MKKAMLELLVFILAALETVYGPQTLYYRRGLFGVKVFKNPARYAVQQSCDQNKTMKLFEEGRKYVETLKLLYSLSIQGCKHHRIRA